MTFDSIIRQSAMFRCMMSEAKCYVSDIKDIIMHSLLCKRHINETKKTDDELERMRKKREHTKKEQEKIKKSIINNIYKKLNSLSSKKQEELVNAVVRHLLDSWKTIKEEEEEKEYCANACREISKIKKNLFDDDVQRKKQINDVRKQIKTTIKDLFAKHKFPLNPILSKNRPLIECYLSTNDLIFELKDTNNTDKLSLICNSDDIMISDFESIFNDLYHRYNSANLDKSKPDPTSSPKPAPSPTPSPIPGPAPTPPPAPSPTPSPAPGPVPTPPPAPSFRSPTEYEFNNLIKIGEEISCQIQNDEDYARYESYLPSIKKMAKEMLHFNTGSREWGLFKKYISKIPLNDDKLERMLIGIRIGKNFFPCIDAQKDGKTLMLEVNFDRAYINGSDPKKSRSKDMLTFSNDKTKVLTVKNLIDASKEKASGIYCKEGFFDAYDHLLFYALPYVPNNNNKILNAISCNNELLERYGIVLVREKSNRFSFRLANDIITAQPLLMDGFIAFVFDIKCESLPKLK